MEVVFKNEEGEVVEKSIITATDGGGFEWSRSFSALLWGMCDKCPRGELYGVYSGECPLIAWFYLGHNFLISYQMVRDEIRLDNEEPRVIPMPKDEYAGTGKVGVEERKVEEVPWETGTLVVVDQDPNPLCDDDPAILAAQTVGALGEIVTVKPQGGVDSSFLIPEFTLAYRQVVARGGRKLVISIRGGGSWAATMAAAAGSRVNLNFWREIYFVEDGKAVRIVY